MYVRETAEKNIDYILKNQNGNFREVLPAVKKKNYTNFEKALGLLKY